MFIYYISSVCQRQYTSLKLYKKNVCFAGFMNDIYILFFNMTNNNFSFQIDTSIGIAVQVLQPYHYIHTSVLSTNFLPRPGPPFLLDFLL